MRVLIDLAHPADPYIFLHLVRRLQAEGHEVKLTGRDKDILVQICENLGLGVEIFGKARKGVGNLAREMLYRQWRLRGIIRTFKPDVILSVAGAFIAPIGRLYGIPTYIFYDTEHATISNAIAYPFATCTYVPVSYRDQIRWRHVRYEGYQELAYLHPNHFSPDPSVLGEVGLNEGDTFSIVRFVGWGAAHDVGLRGFTPENKVRAVHELRRFGRVFITAEDPLPGDLENDRLTLDVSRIHDLMAYAALVFGESATMASEAACLGVPSIFVDPVGRGYNDEQEERYGLVHNFTPERQDEAIAKAVEILADYDREYWRERGRRLLGDKVDVSEMMYRIVMERPFANSK